MIPGQFDYVRPANLDDVLRILKDREGEAKLLSGGYSLIPLIKLRLAQPALLVDLRDIDGMDTIVETDDDLRIGARATHRQIHDHPAVQNYPGILDATALIGDPQVRNWGTIGGSVAHADPASDWPALLLATRATIVCRSGTGERVIAARDFFLDTFTTAIEPTEVLTEIRIPRRVRGTGGAYTKLERKVGDFATCGAAVRLSIGADGTITQAGDRDHRRGRDPVRRDRRGGDPGRGTSARGALRGGGCGGRGAGATRQRCPRQRRIQARDGRGDDRPVAPLRHPARPRVQVGRGDR